MCARALLGVAIVSRAFDALNCPKIHSCSASLAARAAAHVMRGCRHMKVYLALGCALD